MELSEKDLALQRDQRGEKNKVREWLGEFLDVDKMNSRILKRLELLNSLTSFVEEEKEAIGYARKLFEYYRNSKPERIFSPEEERIALVGVIMADIGKTGPASASESQQAVIIRLFGIEGVRDVKTPIRDFLRTKFPETAARDIELLKEMNIDPSMPIEKFWRLHSKWTLQIIEGDGIPEKDLPGAALHHVLEGDNVELLDEAGNFKEIVVDCKTKLRFGENRRFDRPEKLVVLLDKYSAFIKRIANINHGRIIERLKELVARNDRFKNDPGFLELIDDLDKALEPPHEESD